ncbi:MAG: putative toxin-antitoxin system toxin component, PIN family [Armatimonadota bacterium]|nr:putative toxin-antitoxin system toxin component, PIN family [Armatimonadota bacterium]
MSKPRVLVDTNVLLSGLIWNGNEAQLLEMAISGDIGVLMPEIVLEEARRVLAGKFPGHTDALDRVVDVIDCEIVPRPPSASLERAKQALRDINDAEILASIIESKPGYAVTGDKDLLTAEALAVFPTSRRKDFLRKIAGEG